ncbi:munc13-4-like [Tropilaelaps mercedesae]|uniref:Munc13-4-like n=1 Tax=Tropilaelaps mercedesae TaxID=418985 RepID=A0A1V9X5Y2_9ACAR|nr:munc13-4-like [Tropilaelaps mercedesae]
MGKKREVHILPFFTNWYKGRKSDSDQPLRKDRAQSDSRTNVPRSADEKSWDEALVDAVNGTNEIQLRYRVLDECGKGTFGTVFKIEVDTLDPDEKVLAMKVIKHKKRAKMREINMMKTMHHVNLIKLRYHCTIGLCQLRVRQMLFMDFMPESLHAIILRHKKERMPIPPTLVRCFIYQVCRGLSFMHYRGIAHRDLKPLNILVDVPQGTLKICDFGSAKMLADGVPNTAYICSRWYRAPELLYGNKRYTCSVDVWSVGCCLGEMLRLMPIFRGSSTADQLEKIMKVLGAPTRREAAKLGGDIFQSNYPPRDLDSFFECRTSKLTRTFLLRLLRYAPCDRPTAWESLVDPFFDELRAPNCCLPNSGPLPDLFNFTEEELEYNTQLNAHLLPKQRHVGIAQFSPQDLDRLLKLHKADTQYLIEMYCLQRLEEQRRQSQTTAASGQGGASPYGYLSVRTFYNASADSLTVDVMNARDLLPLDPNGYSDPFVLVELQPRHLFPNCPQHRTRVQKRTLYPLFDETFEFSVTVDKCRQEVALLCFTVMDHDMMTRNDFEGEAFLPLTQVPGVNGGENIRNITPMDLPLLQPKEKNEILGALEARQWDREAQEFVKHQKRRKM